VTGGTCSTLLSVQKPKEEIEMCSVHSSIGGTSAACKSSDRC
jgi:hypothetical protein